MKRVGPIFTSELLPVLDEKLITVLRSISKNEWFYQTIAPEWKVKDVAAHLLDGNIRSLSMLRDGYFGEQPGNINLNKDLVSFLNQLNADWISSMKRVSPAMIIELLEITGKEYCTILQSLDPFENALLPVAWAGETQSPNWFHIAREYTEKWHHQQQIRLAVDQAGPLYAKELYHPHLDTSMRALPFHYRGINGNAGEYIRIIITGEGGGEWNLYHDGVHWDLMSDITGRSVCEITIDGTIAWRLFTRGISRAEAVKYVIISGRPDLGEKIFDMLAVMA
jgi:Mycothiol maleylpyruvate isomerase N-terminal domain